MSVNAYLLPIPSHPSPSLEGKINFCTFADVMECIGHI